MPRACIGMASTLRSASRRSPRSPLSAAITAAPRGVSLNGTAGVPAAAPAAPTASLRPLLTAPYVVLASVSCTSWIGRTDGPSARNTRPAIAPWMSPIPRGSEDSSSVAIRASSRASAFACVIRALYPKSSRVARLLPDVDARVHRVLVDLGELGLGELEVLERGHVGLELPDARRADQRGCDARVAEHPGDRHLRQLLAAPLRDLVERAHALHVLLVDEVLLEEVVLGRARVLGDAAEVAVGEHSLAERRERDDAHAVLVAGLQDLGLDPAVEQRVRRLVD